MAALTGEDPPADAAPAEATEEPRRYVVLTALWPIFELFTAAERCWRIEPMSGVPLGLDLLQVRQLADAFGVAWDAEALRHLQAMEAAALKVWLAEIKRRQPKRT